MGVGVLERSGKNTKAKKKLRNDGNILYLDCAEVSWAYTYVKFIKLCTLKNPVYYMFQYGYLPQQNC